MFDDEVEDSDWTPGAWAGHDFSAAKASYDTDVKSRSYTAALAKKVDASGLIQDNIATDATSALIVVTDVTGSMDDWPGAIFGKLPLLDMEGQNYLGADGEISFWAVGDAYSDKYPLQTTNFANRQALTDSLKQLIIEKGGGGQAMETYELAALYALHNVETPEVIGKPVIVFIADESPYANISVDIAKAAKVTLEREVTTEQVFEDLMKRYEVFLIYKEYDSSHSTKKRWVELIGSDRIAILNQAERVVDVLFGLLARVTGREEYFEEELKGRQNPGQVNTVFKALKTVMLPSKDSKALTPYVPQNLGTKSTTLRTSKANSSKKLM